MFMRWVLMLLAVAGLAACSADRAPDAADAAGSVGAFLSARRFTLIGMNRQMAFSPFFTNRPFSRHALKLAIGASGKPLSNSCSAASN